ncbi:ThuA domain-containing protein [Bacillus sp. ISL-39]|uniref:ThuA domain-containing protein n=1 Tax=Bacillus sp. ISL-39 TaxID=2819124 RepID=UPI001BE5D6A0|nr:ThuA domain-containing protein [Bacillus sp. ISL-39]MBT2638623.1 ThuA domain-containing protein [Bacillus sp. ISL-39]
MKKIVAVLGDYWHQENMIQESLEAAVKNLPVEVSYIRYQDLEKALNDDPAAVILYKENRLNPLDEIVETWMEPAIMNQIVAYVEQGGGWFAWHTGMASYPADSSYIKMLKGSFTYHPDMQEVTYKYNDGSVACSFIDEHYFVSCQTEETDVFLFSESVDGHSIAGWQHRFGKGRVCCLAPAHTKEGLNDTHFLSILSGKLAYCIGGNE